MTLLLVIVLLFAIPAALFGAAMCEAIDTRRETNRAARLARLRR